jgi:predicted TIM-barrel fold metal-dependent hydrolase
MPGDRVAAFAPQGIDHELRRLYYDTADAAYAPSMAAIMGYVPASQILFGTDYPFVRVETNTSELQQRRLSPSELAAIQRDNVLRLMPRLA